MLDTDVGFDQVHCRANIVLVIDIVITVIVIIVTIIASPTIIIII